jgi:hypothetical protein
MTRKIPARRAAGTALQLAELSVAAPQVIAHRLARIALSQPNLSTRDRQEFAGMIMEKQAAMFQAWMAVVLETLRWQQAVALALLTGASAGQHHATATSAAMRMASGALGPFHRKAVANAKRLARTRLR